MRVLFKDKDDGALFIVDATMVNYNPTDQILFCSFEDITVEVYDISPAIADSTIKTLFQNGNVDLSEYNAVAVQVY